MYSGLVLTRFSGRLMGAHQKIDRVAHRHLAELLPKRAFFPDISQILEFEGTDGPDGIKRKSPGKDEPWHFLNPLHETEAEKFFEVLDQNYSGLVTSLKARDDQRAAFEAAWLAHAVVDGLTPAHHYPYEKEINSLRVGGNKGRKSIRDKIIFAGRTRRQTLSNTYKVYGPKGLLSSHFTFEYGVNLIIQPLRLPDAKPTKEDLNELAEVGPHEYFLRRAREVAVLELYEDYLKSGWTPRLTSRIRHQLAPSMVKTVAVLWYAASKEARQ